MPYLDGVSVTFDGSRAIDNLSITLAPGEMRAVIGPNGAGKTTIMGIITGKTRPDTGDVIFAETIDLTGTTRPGSRSLASGANSTRIRSSTICCCRWPGERGVVATLFARPTAAERERIDDLLATVHLRDRRDNLAGGLSHGQKQWLEIGMLLAQDSKVLLVDEPAAGMTDAETAKTADLLKRIAGQYPVMVVEHDMAFVRALETRVTVLHEGRVLAEGSLDHVSADPEVVAVYLGR